MGNCTSANPVDEPDAGGGWVAPVWRYVGPFSPPEGLQGAMGLPWPLALRVTQEIAPSHTYCAKSGSVNDPVVLQALASLGRAAQACRALCKLCYEDAAWERLLGLFASASDLRPPGPVRGQFALLWFVHAEVIPKVGPLGEQTNELGLEDSMQTARARSEGLVGAVQQALDSQIGWADSGAGLYASLSRVQYATLARGMLAGGPHIIGNLWEQMPEIGAVYAAVEGWAQSVAAHESQEVSVRDLMEQAREQFHIHIYDAATWQTPMFSTDELLGIICDFLEGDDGLFEQSSMEAAQDVVNQPGFFLSDARIDLSGCVRLLWALSQACKNPAEAGQVRARTVDAVHVLEGCKAIVCTVGIGIVDWCTPEQLLALPAHDVAAGLVLIQRYIGSMDGSAVHTTALQPSSTAPWRATFGCAVLNGPCMQAAIDVAKQYVRENADAHQSCGMFTAAQIRDSLTSCGRHSVVLFLAALRDGVRDLEEARRLRDDMRSRRRCCIQ